MALRSGKTRFEKQICKYAPNHEPCRSAGFCDEQHRDVNLQIIHTCGGNDNEIKRDRFGVRSTVGKELIQRA